MALRARHRPEEDRRRAGPDPARTGRAHDAEPLLRVASARAGLRAGDAREPRQAIELVQRCLDDALESGVRLDLTELQARELRHTLLADLEGFLRDEAASDVTFVPRRLEVAFGSDRAAPELQRGLDARRRPLALREDRPDRHRPVQRPRHRPGLQVGQGRALARGTSTATFGCRSPSTSSRFAISWASSRSEASTARSPGSGSPAGCCASPRATTSPASRRTTTSTRTLSGLRSRLPGSELRVRPADPRRRRAARSERRRLPGVVRPLADVPGGRA